MTNSITKPPIWFWIVSVVALIWNAMGVMQYLAQAYNTENFREQYTADQLELIANTPSWVIAVFAIAVFTGLFGSIALLLRKKWAYSLFLISLIAVAAQMIYNLFIAKAVDVYGTAALITSIMILIFAVLFLLFSKKAVSKQWIV